ncbi:chemotaxis protein CheB [Paenibacillus turpanensis]|uniref:chemotaxis protein CheB n=1 Tax=Paenibacillus turpanensis TaxID=2689078 RepID=UPI00140A305B|nr:chemotaxis protein CheB [Paenibacillus turpanensis]
MEQNQAPNALEENESTGYIVGIGASAGGLEALEKFFGKMSPYSGMSFVIVQHLSPNYKSFMVELLSKHTAMKIVEVEHQMKVEPNVVYLIPPKSNMTIINRVLQLKEKSSPSGLNMPIDLFFESLAEDVGPAAIAVVLSGTGSDGTKGIRAVKKRGGLVLVQDEQSAKFDGMPKSAIMSGHVDYVISPENMHEYLMEHAQSNMATKEYNENELATPELMSPTDVENYVLDIFRLIQEESGVDFTYYKRNSVLRRIERRLSLHNMSSIVQYYDYLKENPTEIHALRKDLLIGVTNFFRDPLAFEVIRTRVLPAIFERKKDEQEIRVWVAACSTGEEAYSIAITLKEYMDRTNQWFNVKIFATDLEKDSIEYASQGIYPESIMDNMSEEQLDRHFIRDGDVYQIRKEIRKMIVFAPHNITKDPPFSNLDLITCRNMLIYMQPEMQKKVLSLFHFALVPTGFLFLGPSETLGRLTNLFTAFDRRWNIFQQRDESLGRAPNEVELGENVQAQVMEHRKRVLPGIRAATEHKKIDDIYTTFVDEHMQPCMVVDENNDIVHLSGPVNKFLALAKGKPSWNVYKMVEANLAVAIMTAVQKVRKEKQPVVYRNMTFAPDESILLHLTVKPFSRKKRAFERLVLVMFEEEQMENLLEDKSTVTLDLTSNVNHRIVELEQELQRAEERLQATIEELETSNEELQATNEELVAANEELQSTNEELQSVNEELVTVNTEYQYKIQELTEVNNDMDNFLISTKIGTIFLDKNMCIRRFTPAITREINLMDVDYGRPIAHISHSFKYEGLVDDAKMVLRTLIPVEKEIESRNGKWYSMRVLPYRTTDNFVKGIVLTFVDITELKLINQELIKLSYAIEQSPSIIVITNSEGRIEYANPQFMRLTGFAMENVVGRDFHFLNLWESQDKHKEVWETISNGFTWQGELEGKRRDGSNFWETVKMLPITDQQGQVIHFLRIAEDISGLKETEELLRKSEMLSALGQMAAGIAHEIRNPLTALKGFTKLISTGKHSDSYVEIMSTELERIEHIVGELLVLAKPQALEFRPASMKTVLGDVVMLLETQAIINNVEIECLYHTENTSVYCVENQLKQVFINLIKNSVEAMPSGGRIEVTVSELPNERLQLRFKDQGTGIPKSKLAKLGEPFYTTKNKGTGLGLMVSYKIIENHQGRIVIESEEGKGTTVTIVLPLDGREAE